ncbi:MAG: hypothetical protein U0529_14190 [Thermoanaerobaculia bacterium]
MKARHASFLKSLLGFGLSVFAALSVVSYRLASAPDRDIREAPTHAAAFARHLFITAPFLCALALLGFAVGLVPAVLLRAAVPRPVATGIGIGLFWVVIGIAGVPYSLGLTAPAGIFIVSVFLAVFVSAASIGVALARGQIGDAA